MLRAKGNDKELKKTRKMMYEQNVSEERNYKNRVRHAKSTCLNF